MHLGVIYSSVLAFCATQVIYSALFSGNRNQQTITYTPQRFFAAVFLFNKDELYISARFDLIYTYIKGIHETCIHTQFDTK